jgi:hypothetical protein
MGNHDVLMISTRPGFCRSLFNRFEGPPVNIVHYSDVTAEQWRDTDLIVVDAVAAPGLITRRFPLREGVVIVTDGTHEKTLWRHATDLGAGNVMLVPDGWPHLRAVVRDVGRGGLVVAVLSTAGTDASAIVAAAVALESCSLGQVCIVLDHNSGPGSVNSYVDDVEGEISGQPGGQLRVADPAGPPPTGFQITGAVRVSRIDHDLVVINLGSSDSPLTPAAVRLADVVVVVTTAGRVAEARSFAEQCRSTAHEVRLLEVPADLNQSVSLTDNDFRATCWAALTVPVPTAPTA